MCEEEGVDGLAGLGQGDDPCRFLTINHVNGGSKQDMWFGDGMNHSLFYQNLSQKAHGDWYSLQFI
jgi:hypothetical protein